LPPDPALDRVAEQVKASGIPDDQAMDVAQRVVDLRAANLARDIVARERAANGWMLPPDVGSLKDMLANPPEPEPYLIDRLQGIRHNVSLTGLFKVGKTTLVMNNLRSFVDRLPFLGRETFLPEDARVCWMNGEMDDSDWLDAVNLLEIENTGAVAPLMLRGYRLPLLNDFVAERFIKWLRDNDIYVLVIDSWRRLTVWSGVDENKDNAGVEQLTARIDEIKKASGVGAVQILAHQGRARHEEGEEHARGATAFDDWVDARWVITKHRSGDRYFYADGRRRVAFPDTQLIFDEAYNEVTLGSGSRADRRRKEKEAGATLDALLVKRISEEHPDGLNSGKLYAALKAAGITKKERAHAAIKAAVEEGYVFPRVRGREHLYMPMSARDSG
jgi:hypothetical protein